MTSVGCVLYSLVSNPTVSGTKQSGTRKVQGIMVHESKENKDIKLTYSNIVHNVQDAKFNLSNQSYMH